MKEDRESAVKRTSTVRGSKAEKPAAPTRKTRAAASGEATGKRVNGGAADAPRKTTRATGTARKSAPAEAAAETGTTAKRRTRAAAAAVQQSAQTPAAEQDAAAPNVPTPNTEERHRMIERIAYFRAQWRGWTPGAELEDWLHAEREVDEMLRRPPSD